jgi:hypothetical protein
MIKVTAVKALEDYWLELSFIFNGTQRRKRIASPRP